MACAAQSSTFLWFFRTVLCVGVACAGLAAGPVESAPAVEPPRVHSLDGPWQLVFDPQDSGRAGGWFQAQSFPAQGARTMLVPGSMCEVEPRYHGVFWCARTFTPSLPASRNLRYYLRFGAVGYACEIWLNGKRIGAHEGSQSPFEFDVTGVVTLDKPNHVVLRIFGSGAAENYAGYNPNGISEHVTLVAQPPVRIRDVFARPDIHTGQIGLEIAVENHGAAPADVLLRAAYGEYRPNNPLGAVNKVVKLPPGATTERLTIKIERPHLWDLDDPFLYTIRVTSHCEAAAPEARSDSYCFRTGLRDFRIVDGFFHLNGKRIYVRSTHLNRWDPIAFYGTPRDMRHLGQDAALLKRAGFNMMRFLLSAALPEQLDIADEAGMLVYTEHDTSWLHTKTTKFGISLNDVVRRDRNHPSLVVWGLLNETEPGPVYEQARAWLPSLRAIDDTRLVLLSSGRWDRDLRTASASNPGATTWNIFLGREDPAVPAAVMKSWNWDKPGDVHLYPSYPITWGEITHLANLARDNRPVFLSESGMGAGCGSLIRVDRKLRKAGAPQNAELWQRIRPALESSRKMWAKYRLDDIYPSPEDMFVDSERNGARQRELMFNIIRSNPRLNGYSLTSAFPLQEGVANPFREFYADHLPVLQAGWAKLRWCLFVNPMHIYSDRPFHVRVALASDDALGAGAYPATLRIAGADKVVLWTKRATVSVPPGPNPPLAYAVFAQDVTVPGLKEGIYTLSAAFDGRENAASHALSFFVSERSRHAGRPGTVTVLGIDPPVRRLLAAHGATLREYSEGQAFDREVILVGKTEDLKAAGWRSLYGRIARGAHAVFLSPAAFAEGKNHARWLAMTAKGDRMSEPDWLYHKDVFAKPRRFMTGLQTKLMTPDYYGELLANTKAFRGVATPDEPVAVAMRCTDSPLKFSEGVMLGTYNHHAGKLTIHAFNLLPMLGHPAADRLLLNMAAHATAATLQPLPENYAAKLDALGIPRN